MVRVNEIPAILDDMADAGLATRRLLEWYVSVKDQPQMIGAAMLAQMLGQSLENQGIIMGALYRLLEDK